MIDLAPDVGMVIVNVFTLDGRYPVRVLHLNYAAVRDTELFIIAAVDKAEIIFRQRLRLPNGTAANVRLGKGFQ